jgi:hypothetical protein
MGFARAAVYLLLARALCPAQPEADFGRTLLMRVHANTRKALARFPNYTCTEVISRSISSSTPARSEYVDRLRLEVAVLGNRELFAWPGAAPFESDHPRDLIGGGLTATGEFATFTRAVLDSDSATYSFGQHELRNQRGAVRYDYRILQPRSGFILRDGVTRAIVGYHGSFWVDPVSGQVIALEVQADDIPEAIDISEARTLIEYKLVRLGEEEFPVPDRSELTVKHRRSSTVTENRIQFSGCRQYTAESTIKFGDSAPFVSSVANASAPAPSVPAGLTLDVALDSPIEVASSAAGDPVSATLAHPLQSGALRIPKGARLLGRILRFEIHVKDVYTLVVVDFTQLEFAGARFDLYGRLTRFDRIKQLSGGSLDAANLMITRDLRLTGRGWRNLVLFTMGGHLNRIPAGFKMKWETIAPPASVTVSRDF